MHAEYTFNASVKPCMISPGSQGDEIVFVLDVLELFGDQRLVLVDVSPDAAVLGCRGAIGGHELLRRSEKCSCPLSAHKLSIYVELIV